MNRPNMDRPNMDRRNFLTNSAALAVAAASPLAVQPAVAKVTRQAGVKLKLGLNAYSFDKPLRDGTMTLADAVLRTKRR